MNPLLVGEGGRGVCGISMDGGRCLKATCWAIICSWLYMAGSSMMESWKHNIILSKVLNYVGG